MEIKSSVENALQDDVLSIDRLNKLCLWVRIPHLHRTIVWKVLMGVLPIYKEAWDFVNDQRILYFQILRESTSILFYSDLRGASSDLTCPFLVQMIVIELSSQSPNELNRIFASEPPRHLMDIATAFLDICDSEEDAFWECLYFVKRYQLSTGFNFQWVEPIMALFRKLLESHNLQLFDHLNSLVSSFYDTFGHWFMCCFARILSPHNIEGIWDIVIGGSPEILSYVALCIVLGVRRKIESCRSISDLNNVMSSISEYMDSDSVSSLSIELWEKPALERNK